MKTTSTGKIILLAVAVAGLFGLLLFAPLPVWNAWAWDIAIFRAAAKALLHGANPYLPENIARFADGAELATIPNYIYSPVFALLIAPLAWLPPWLAFRVWFMVNIFLYFASAILVIQALRWRMSGPGLTGVMLGLAIFAPLRTLLIIGQSGIIMLFFLCLAFWLLKRDRPGWAGAALSLAFFKPHLVLLLPFFVLRRQWHLLAGFIIATTIAVIPFTGLVGDWVRAAFATRGENIHYGCLPFASLNMFLQCVFPDQARLAWFAGSLLLLFGVTVLYLVWSPTRPAASRFDLQFSLVVLAGLLVFDNIRVADLVLVVLPLLVVLRETGLLAMRRLRGLIIALVFPVYILPYIAEVFALTTHNMMWTMPVWYSGIAVTLSAAVSVLMWKDLKDTRARFPSPAFEGYHLET